MATVFPTFVDTPDGETPEPGTPDVDAAYLNAMNGAVNTIENTLPAKVDAAALHPVATSGAYTDLIGRPFIPAAPEDIGAQPAGSYATTTQLAGKADLAHTHPVGDLTATGTADGTTFLRGDGTWALPPGGGGVALHADTHATAGTDPLTPAAIGAQPAGDYALATRLVTAGTGLNGGGDLSADRTLTVTYGATAGTAAQGDDARIVGAEQTSARGVANGYADLDASTKVPSARMPRRTSVVRTVAHAATVAIDAAVDGNLINIAATAAETISEPTNGIDRQVLRIAVYCATAQTITFAAAYRLSTGLSSRAFAVPDGQVLLVAAEFVNSLPSNKWVLTAATMSAA